jgi:hypothetical protein
MSICEIGFGTDFCVSLDDVSFWCFQYGEFEKFLSFTYNCSTITNPYTLGRIEIHGDLETLEDVILYSLKNFQILN